MLPAAVSLHHPESNWLGTADLLVFVDAAGVPVAGRFFNAASTPQRASLPGFPGPLLLVSWKEGGIERTQAGAFAILSGELRRVTGRFELGLDWQEPCDDTSDEVCIWGPPGSMTVTSRGLEVRTPVGDTADEPGCAHSSPRCAVEVRTLVFAPSAGRFITQGPVRRETIPMRIRRTHL